MMKHCKPDGAWMDIDEMEQLNRVSLGTLLSKTHKQNNNIFLLLIICNLKAFKSQTAVK